jgi:small subunit ribosomal protein S2
MSSISVDISVENLFQKSVHYGHKVSKTHPAFSSFVFTKQNNVSIIDLAVTKACLQEVWNVLYEGAKKNKRVLFVGTKDICSSLVKKYALECGQYYVNTKWLGGMITNFKSISADKITELESCLAESKAVNYSKQELIKMLKQLNRLEAVVGGIKNMKRRPDIVFVLDSGVDRAAIEEAQSYGITVIVIADSNVDPRGIDYVIPGNDDHVGAIELYLQVASDAILQGVKQAMIEKSIASTNVKSKK